LGFLPKPRPLPDEREDGIAKLLRPREEEKEASVGGSSIGTPN